MLTGKQVNKTNPFKNWERDLSELELCAIFIDGIEFKSNLLVVALGLDIEGKKHILGLWQGATWFRDGQ